MYPHKRKLLAEANWEVISEELYGLVLWYLNRMTWRSGTPDILPKGKEPADIVYDLITKVFDEERNWDPSEVDLVTFLRGQVYSEVSNLVRSHSHIKEEAIQVNGNEYDDEVLNKRASASNPTSSVEEIVEQSITAAEVKDAVFEAVEGDPELERFFELVLEGYWSENKQIADHMNISVAQANNLKRRFLGRLSKTKQSFLEREAYERAKIDSN